MLGRMHRKQDTKHIQQGSQHGPQKRRQKTKRKKQQEWDTNLQQTTPLFPHNLQRNAAGTRRKFKLMQKQTHLNTLHNNVNLLSSRTEADFKITPQTYHAFFFLSPFMFFVSVKNIRAANLAHIHLNVFADDAPIWGCKAATTIWKRQHWYTSSAGTDLTKKSCAMICP